MEIKKEQAIIRLLKGGNENVAVFIHTISKKIK